MRREGSSALAPGVLAASVRDECARSVRRRYSACRRAGIDFDAVSPNRSLGTLGPVGAELLFRHSRPSPTTKRGSSHADGVARSEKARVWAQSASSRGREHRRPGRRLRQLLSQSRTTLITWMRKAPWRRRITSPVEVPSSFERRARFIWSSTRPGSLPIAHRRPACGPDARPTTARSGWPCGIRRWRLGISSGRSALKTP